MSKAPLFRKEALENRHPKWYGEIILIRPLSFTVLTTCAAAIALILLAFLFFGTYTKRSTILGQLTPNTGVIKVYAPQTGIIKEKKVLEGQAVKQGDVLFVLSSERQSSTQGDTQAKISRQVASRQQSLQDEMVKTRRLHQEEQANMHKRLAALENEARKILNQMDGQKNRMKLAQDAVNRAQELLAQHFISKEQLQQKQADLLDQEGRLQSLERDQLAIARELANQQADLAAAPLKQENQLAQIERLLASTGQELTESEARRSVTITAPESGIATALGVEAGQLVDASKVLVNLVPQRAQLLAELYAPSRSIGFIKPNDPVLVRYQAFPYQKFGHARGKVISVSRTALSSQEISGANGINSGGANAEPMYRIMVQIEKQTIRAYGQNQSLQAGMLLDADVLQEKRRLVEWVLEPLYSLTGKL
jgi:membrane fusion protein